MVFLKRQRFRIKRETFTLLSGNKRLPKYCFCHYLSSFFIENRVYDSFRANTQLIPHVGNARLRFRSLQFADEMRGHCDMSSDRKLPCARFCLSFDTQYLKYLICNTFFTEYLLVIVDLFENNVCLTREVCLDFDHFHDNTTCLRWHW